MTIFEVHDIFVLKDGKTVFAGRYSSGVKVFGAYRVSIDGRDTGVVNIREEMIFSSKDKTDIALCTFDDLSRDDFDLRKKILLTLDE